MTIDTERGAIEGRVLNDYLAILGKIILVRELTAFTVNGMIGLTLDRPLVARVSQTERASLIRWIDDWCDPCWNIDAVLKHPEVPETAPLSIFGRSYCLHGESYPIKPGYELAPPLIAHRAQLAFATRWASKFVTRRQRPANGKSRP